ncbi:MAG: hypothetical protein HY317_05710 [Acidobacteria bacterium]|nr:hypothetical protein [Acidobacteriota bacterium]
MPFACPGCGAVLDRSLEVALTRCPACAAIVRSRPLEGRGGAAAYEVEIAGRPETRRRVEVPWDETQQRRLTAWLAWSSLLTVGLVFVLYALARWFRGGTP